MQMYYILYIYPKGSLNWMLYEEYTHRISIMQCCAVFFFAVYVCVCSGFWLIVLQTFFAHQ